MLLVICHLWNHAYFLFTDKEYAVLTRLIVTRKCGRLRLSINEDRLKDATQISMHLKCHRYVRESLPRSLNTWLIPMPENIRHLVVE